MNDDKKPKSRAEKRSIPQVRSEYETWVTHGDHIKLRIENFPEKTTLADLRKVFSEFGDVSLVSMQSDSRATWALVQLYERTDGEELWFKAIFVHGQRLRVQESQ